MTSGVEQGYNKYPLNLIMGKRLLADEGIRHWDQTTTYLHANQWQLNLALL